MRFAATVVFLAYLIWIGECGSLRRRIRRQGTENSLLTRIQEMKAESQRFVNRNPASEVAQRFRKIIQLADAMETLIRKSPGLNYRGFSGIRGYNPLVTNIQRFKEDAAETLKNALTSGKSIADTEPTRFGLSQLEKLEEIITWKPTETLPNPKLPRVCGLARSVKDKIRGGNYVEPGAYPWMAQLISVHKNLGTSGLPICGGTLITRNAVLTAAHCMRSSVRLKPEEIIVRLGQVNATGFAPLNPNAGVFGVKAIKVHANYVSTKFGNDIAILILKTDVKISDTILPICLPYDSTLRKNDFNDRLAVVAGWGTLGKDQNQSYQLQDLRLQVTSQDNCAKAYDKQAERSSIKPTMICAADREKGNKDACKGDSGGPLMVIQGRYYIVGIVSFGLADCGNDFKVPGVYTRVTEFMDWTLQNI